MRASLRIDGLPAARKRIDDVGDRARAPEPALRSSGTRMALQLSEQRRFFGGYRFRPASKEWVARKRREGLSTRTMVASGRLSSALINAESGSIRFTVYNGVLTWGLRQGRSQTYYAQVQAAQGRKAVVIDRIARENIADRVQSFLAHGFVT